MTEPDPLLVERPSDAIAVFRLNRPQVRNALSLPLRARLADEISRYAADECPLREENFFTLALRADRALKFNAYAENPPARTRRFVTNIEVFSGEKAGEMRVFSNLLLYYSRHGSEHFIYSGQRRDVLRHDGESFKVAAREVILDWNIITAPTVGLLF